MVDDEQEEVMLGVIRLLLTQNSHRKQEKFMKTAEHVTVCFTGHVE